MTNEPTAPRKSKTPPPLHVPLTLEQLAAGLMGTPPRPAQRQPSEADVKTPKAKKPARKKKP